MKRRARLIPSRRRYNSLLLRQSSAMERWSLGEIEPGREEMDRRAFLEGLCVSIAGAGLKSPGEAEAHALVRRSIPGLNSAIQGGGESLPETTHSAAGASIAGEWRIRLDPADTGIGEKWF